MIKWRTRILCWIPKATNAHTVCVTLIAFPLQQRLRERASLLRYTYIVWVLKSALIRNIWTSHDFGCKKNLYQNFGICLPNYKVSHSSR